VAYALVVHVVHAIGDPPQHIKYDSPAMRQPTCPENAPVDRVPQAASIAKLLHNQELFCLTGHPFFQGNTRDLINGRFNSILNPGSSASAAAMLARRSCDYGHPVGMQQQSLSGQEPVHFTLVECN
jgi:hypothetical protein